MYAAFSAEWRARQSRFVNVVTFNTCSVLGHGGPSGPVPPHPATTVLCPPPMKVEPKFIGATIALKTNGTWFSMTTMLFHWKKKKIKFLLVMDARHKIQDFQFTHIPVSNHRIEDAWYIVTIDVLLHQCQGLLYQRLPKFHFVLHPQRNGQLFDYARQLDR